MEAAARIIQTQLDAGALESAVLEFGRGSEKFERAFGQAGTPKAMFLLGSITKPLTAVATMVLADRGELRLADRVMKFIPEFSEGDRQKVTIEHLLTHTSGLPDQLVENNALRARHAPLSEFVRATVRAPLLFAPASKYHYQSMGILLAAEIVERVTKRTLPEFLEKEVFTPLGMARTVLGLGKFEKADMVSSQTKHAAPESGGGDSKARDWDWNSDYWRRLAAPWGGAHSTAADLSVFLRSFLHPDGRVLREETARRMVQNHTEGLAARRGLGFALGPAGFGKGCSEKAFGHSGSTGTLAWADPATDTTCVILTSLPASVSRDTILHPVSDLVALADFATGGF
jgi:CubicO group peptidase (beta-lactamase class C family)